MQIASPHCKGHLLVLVRMKAIRLYHQAGQWYKLPNNDPLGDPLGSSVKTVKTVNVTHLVTRLLTFRQYPGFSFASHDVATALSPPRQSLNDGSLANAHFFVIVLIDSLWSGGKSSLAFHKAWAWSIFSAFHC